MSLIQINIHDFRNLSSVSFLPNSSINLIQGPNGIGKTSLLEAIYVLGLGKSFRTHVTQRIIRHGTEKFSISGKILGPDEPTIQIGIEKYRDGKSKMRLSGNDLTSSGELAKLLPLQLINPHTFQLLEGGPSLRRQFVDWGVFHVELDFLNAWRSYVRALKQRNMLLKSEEKKDAFEAWNYELVKYGNQINAYRKSYLDNFLSLFKELIGELLPISELNLQYNCGWNEEKSYEQVLQSSFMRDKTLKYTQFGPHHADLIIKIDKNPAKDILSRGQQKLFVCALKITQGLLFQQEKEKKCIYLLDDLIAELDQENQRKIISLLVKQETQLFITCTDQQHSMLKAVDDNHAVEVFHMERFLCHPERSLHCVKAK